MTTPVLELRDITKQFPGVLANDHIHLTLEQGEIHALLGENGAGKTTLMNILYGLYSADEGEIRVRGRNVDIHMPSDAIALGIGMVHQHFMLVPVMTVTENIMLGAESTRFGPFLDIRTARQRIQDLSQRYGLNVDPDAYIKDLPVGIQQRVEILKLLYRKADILILDEPTAVLTPQEVEELFEIIRSLVAQGNSIIFISHKLKEVMTIADRITVLRRGRVVGTTRPSETSEEELAAMMVGREVQLIVEKKPARPGDVVLSLENLQVLDERGEAAVRGVTLEVRSGEIVGIAGVQGNGQTELVEAITGLRAPIGGHIRIKGKDTTWAGSRNFLEQGAAHVPEDRQRDGLVLSYPVRDNLILNVYYRPPFAHGFLVREAPIEEHARRLVREFDIRTPSIYTPVANLSGGNQQKVIVAREFSRPIDLLVASQPTRGLDVGSIEYIHKRLVQKRDEGCAVLLVSSELDEIMALSDRIAIMYEGRIIDVLPAQEATREQLGLLMAGIRPDEQGEAGEKA